MPWEYILPAGLVRIGAGEPALEERFEVQWRGDDESPHYFYWVQASALRLERLVADAILLLPPRVQVILEIRQSDEAIDADPDLPSQIRFASGVVPREAALAVWKEHGPALVHDGMVGFGAYDPQSSLEVFLDDHKLLSLFAPSQEPFDALLERHGIPEGDTFPTILDHEHDHVPLVDLPKRAPCVKRAWPKRRHHDVAWFAPAIRRALRMRRQKADPGHGE